MLRNNTRAGGGDWAALPTRMKILHVTTRRSTKGWLSEALRADSALEPALEEAIGAADGCARLREVTFDVIVVTHQPELLDALQFVEGLRAGKLEEPVVVLGSECQQQLAPLCFEVGADAYCEIQSTTTRMLIWTLARAVRRHALLCENRRLTAMQRRTKQQQRQDAQRLLAGQKAIAGKLPWAELPEPLVARYRELLQAYLIMGSGTLSGELLELAENLLAHGVTAQQVFRLHVHVLDGLLLGLGGRSARHVITRADMLVLEMMLQLSACHDTPQSTSAPSP